MYMTVQRNNFLGIHSGIHCAHSDVSQESYSFELFNLPLDLYTLGMENKPGIHGLFISVEV